MKGLLAFFLTLLLLLTSACARYNRVAVVVRNNTGFQIERLTLRFGDSLHIVKNLSSSQRSRVLRSNKTFGNGFVKAILPGGDTLKTYPINRHGEKFYHEGKVLVSLLISKKPDGSDTLVTRSRRRLF